MNSKKPSAMEFAKNYWFKACPPQQIPTNFQGGINATGFVELSADNALKILA